MHPTPLTILLPISMLAIVECTSGVRAPMCGMLLRFLHVLYVVRILFYCCFVFHCINIPHLFTCPPLFDTVISGFTMNDYVVNICKHGLSGHMFSFFLGRCLGVELLGHVVSLCLLSKTAQLFSKVVVPFHRFQFLHVLTNTWYYLFFCLWPF